MADRAQSMMSDNGLLDHTAYWLHRLSSAVLKQFETSLAETGVTAAQWKVMLVLYRADATTTFSVANFIDVDPGSVTRVVERLVTKGLVARTPSADDRRSIALALTPKGHALLEEHLLPIADAQDDDWLASLSLAEVLVFKGLLAKLLAKQGIAAPDRWLRSGLCTEPR